eukprot:7285295-Lingulodinium_polyedra.AAC.1
MSRAEIAIGGPHLAAPVSMSLGGYGLHPCPCLDCASVHVWNVPVSMPKRHFGAFKAWTLVQS